MDQNPPPLTKTNRYAIVAATPAASRERASGIPGSGGQPPVIDVAHQSEYAQSEFGQGSTLLLPVEDAEHQLQVLSDGASPCGGRREAALGARQHGSANQVILSAPTPSQRQSSLGERRRFTVGRTQPRTHRRGYFCETRLFHWNADVAPHRLLPYQGPGRPRVLAMSAAVRVFVLQTLIAKLADAEARASHRRPAAHRSYPTAHRRSAQFPLPEGMHSSRPQDDTRAPDR